MGLSTTSTTRLNELFKGTPKRQDRQLQALKFVRLFLSKRKEPKDVNEFRPAKLKEDNDVFESSETDLEEI